MDSLRQQIRLYIYAQMQELPRGAILTMDQTWALAKLWYEDRLTPAFRRRTPQEATEAFASIGLTGEFWTFM